MLNRTNVSADESSLSQPDVATDDAHSIKATNIMQNHLDLFLETISYLLMTPGGIEPTADGSKTRCSSR